MRALLINPRLQTIIEIDYDGTSEAMCKLIGSISSRLPQH